VGSGDAGPSPARPRGDAGAAAAAVRSPAGSTALGWFRASLRPQRGQDARQVTKNTDELMGVTQFLLSVLSGTPALKIRALFLHRAIRLPPPRRRWPRWPRCPGPSSGGPCAGCTLLARGGTCWGLCESCSTSAPSFASSGAVLQPDAAFTPRGCAGGLLPAGEAGRGPPPWLPWDRGAIGELPVWGDARGAGLASVTPRWGQSI